MSLLERVKKLEPKKGTLAHTVFDGFFTFLYTPNMVTASKGVQIRDRIDLKRTMVIVVVALQLCYLFGTFNIGHQHFAAQGLYTGYLEGLHLKLVYGLVKILPIFVVTHVVGLGIEFYYAYKKGHAIEEGFLVSGALIPLIMPPDIPLWILGIAVAFAVIVGKEAFGGTGMNILNIALLARVFIFFAYPTEISGDNVWIAGLVQEGGVYAAQTYGWIFGVFDGLFSSIGWAQFGPGGNAFVDGFTGATPLALAAKGGWTAVTEVYSANQILWGAIPGSIGETSKPLILAGIALLILSGIASWRIMLSFALGAALTALLMNLLTNGTVGYDFLQVPWYFQFYMGSLLFALAFMATDPVTASGTNTGKWIYGFFIGSIGMIVRVMNPAYPEGWMLAILFMNVFAPLIDYYVLKANMNRRAKRAQVQTVNA
ncbi:MAG: NADH:ubiquinone reductase (Na(+)-transporting) subunit B [Saprospiraceae bacterium]|jgi:Na+-transporting NADH:ubiquinone oxidoreductase subunit B